MRKTSFFRQFLVFLSSFFKMQMRNRSSLFFVLFFPIILILVFGFFKINADDEIKIGIVPSESVVYYDLKKPLEDISIFDVVIEDEEYLQSDLRKGRLDAIVKFGDQEVILLAGSERVSDVETARYLIESVINESELTSYKITKEVAVQEEDPDFDKASYLDFLLPGILGFSILMITVNGTAYSFLTLKKNKALKRVFAAPTSSSAFILGSSFSKLLFALLQNLLIISLAALVFEFTPEGGDTAFLEMFAIVILGIVVFLGLGHVVAAMTKQEDTISPIVSIIIFPQILLSGTFFSVNHFPDWLKNIAEILPLYSFNEALRLISLDGMHLWDSLVLTELGIMGLWGVAVYLIASKVFRVR